MLIKNALVLTPDHTFRKMDVRFDGHIRETGSFPGNPDIDAEGYFLVPGLIDVHTHGAAGHDFSDGSSDDIGIISRHFASRGVTSFCATTMTLPESSLVKAMRSIRDFRRPADGARCAGVNLEGPFLSYQRRGAQAAEYLRDPDIDMYWRLNAASGSQVKLISVAPELPGAAEFIREVSKSCAVSVAHSAAGYETAIEAFQSGASQATHLFNGMNQLHHRDPAIIGAAFDSGAYAELICDGLHIHPSVIRIVFRLFGKKTLLISDSLRCAGMPDGCCELGGQPIVVRKGRATLLNGTLAGSCISLLEGVRNAIRFGIAPEDAFCAATEAPAKAIGIDGSRGSIESGKLSDMLILDNNFNLVTTIINGEISFRTRC